MPYKDLKSPEAKESRKRCQENYRKTERGKEVRNRGNKKWRDKPENKEKLKEYMKEYRKTDKYKRNHTISTWKRRGLIETDNYTYNSLYDKYLIHTNCDICNIILTTGKRCPQTKMMDHDHKTGEFRNFLCCDCNLRRG
jgi:hypothetical protein